MKTITQLVDDNFIVIVSNRYQVFDVTCIVGKTMDFFFPDLRTNTNVQPFRSKLTSRACEPRAGLVRRLANRDQRLSGFNCIRCSYIEPMMYTSLTFNCALYSYQSSRTLLHIKHFTNVLHFGHDVTTAHNVLHSTAQIYKTSQLQHNALRTETVLSTSQTSSLYYKHSSLFLFRLPLR